MITERPIKRLTSLKRERLSNPGILSTNNCS